MPSAPVGFCATPGCSARANGHCPQHASVRRRMVDTHRGSARERGYTTEWDRFSRAWKAQHPWCGERADGRLHAEHSLCVQAGQRNIADVTDHIIPLSAGGAHCDETNSQSLCNRCNTVKGNG